ncbi:MAG: protein kinase [Ktedonobacteraceae bacterium]|nr:protein kinase [Ktedonobacteraceae bacterium]
MALPIGTILDGKFKIVQVLGEGGMGTVYKVEQIGTNPPYYYAVKELLISPNTSEEDRRAAIDRFNREIALLRGLKHPRIAALMLPFQERGNSYFAMEFVPGRSLEKRLEDAKGPLPEQQVIKWMIQVCEALSYIHTRNPPIILRDLKPGNVMITPDDEVQLIDFGIARRFDPNKRTNTENLGTISYASPEHLGSITMPGQRRTAQNPGKLVQTDARSDIYSLGATMYHLLTNYEPDPIQTPTPGSVRAKNPRLRAVQVGGKTVCPVEQVIIKAMQQDPAQRFQSADAMRVALQQCLPNAAPSTVQIPAMTANATIVVHPAGGAHTGNGTSGLICPKCGFQNRLGAKFCKRDGQPLVAGVAAPPQIRAQAARVPIQARPVQQAIPSRPSQPIKARPVQSASIQARPAQPILARPVSSTTADPMIAYRAGLQQLASKNFPAAISQFKLAQTQGNTSYDVLYNLGRAHRQYGQSVREQNKKLFSENMTSGAEYFEEAVRLKPDAFDAYFQLGMCYRDLAIYPKAATTFKKSLALAPKDPAIYYQLGLVAVEQGSNREAETYFQDGLKINPDHALILVALGRLYAESRQQLPAAISTLQHATQVDPALWEAWYELGRAHMKEREWKYALSALERARQVNIYASEIYSAMAACFLKMNKKLDARQMVSEALQRDPNNAEAIRLQKQI